VGDGTINEAETSLSVHKKFFISIGQPSAEIYVLSEIVFPLHYFPPNPLQS
jgi:hypothetical protein